jgi:hypothetical protein
MKRNLTTAGAGLIGVIAIGLAGSFPAAAQPRDQAALTDALVLNGLSRWQTDPAVRSAMAGMRDSLFAQRDAVAAGALTARQYETLAAQIERRVADIVANGALTPAADAQLHAVLSQLLQSAAAMSGVDPNLARRTAALRAFDAIDAYGRHFEHPAW